MNDFNAKVISEFRANGGKVEQFGDAPLVILHTIGAKSGELREIPLVTLAQGENLYVFASKAGAPSHPDWYYNLKANPEITVETPNETFDATVLQMPTDAGQKKLAEQAELMPQFADYVESAAPRIIPVFSIQRS